VLNEEFAQGLQKSAQRKLNKKTIESIIKNPDKVVESIYERKIAQKIINGKLIRVIYKEESGKIIVITSYPCKPERYGDKK
jgi:hypothetical protein